MLCFVNAIRLQPVTGVAVEGFVGCIQSLAIKDSRQNVINYNLSSDGSSDIEKRVNIGWFNWKGLIGVKLS